MNHALNPDLTVLTRRTPARSGRPWTDDDHERLLALVREGHSTETIADTLGRGEQATLNRMRALLRPTERKCPADRVLPALHDHLVAEPDYPWAEIILQSAPPPPIVRQEIHRDSWAGLEPEALVDVAWALLTTEGVSQERVTEVCAELQERGLTARVTDRYRRALLRRVPPVTMSEVEESCCRWFGEASGHPTPDSYFQSGYDDWAWR